MKRFSGIAAFALLAAGAAAPGGASAEQQFVIGVSNTHIGNSWREEFVCSIKAEALASGLVSKVILANREAGPSEQIADLRTLISAGVNAIIINPSDEKALNGVIKAAADKGIVVVAADQPVSAPEAYIVTGDQVTYAKVGAKWLFDQLKGKGDVYQMRGIDGAPGDGSGRRASTRFSRITQTSRSLRRPSWTGPTKKPRSRCRQCWRQASTSMAFGRRESTIR
jgi:ribose transport system substrate-binding protein